MKIFIDTDLKEIILIGEGASDFIKYGLSKLVIDQTYKMTTAPETGEISYKTSK